MRLSIFAIVLTSTAVNRAYADVAAASYQAPAQVATEASVSDHGSQSTRDKRSAILQAVRAEALTGIVHYEAMLKNSWPYTPVFFPAQMCIFERGLCGVVNRDGTVVVPPLFDWVGSFHDGLALVRLAGLYGYVNLAGQVVVEPKYRLAGDYWHGFAEVDIDGKSALIDRQGRMVLEPKFTRALPFNSSTFWVKDGTRRSVNKEGFEVLVENLDDIELKTDFVVDGDWKLIDRTGRPVPTPKIATIRYFDPSDDTSMWARTEDGWGLIKPDGTWLVPPKYQDVGAIAGGLGAVRSAGRWGYIDRIGTVIIPPTFEAAQSFDDTGMAPVKSAGKWGYVDRTGAMVIQPQFDSAEVFDSGGLAAAKLGAFSGMIDRSGSWVIKPQFDRISLPRKDVIWVEVNEKIGVYERSGRLIASPQFSQMATVCDDGWVLGYADGRSQIIRDRDRPLTLPTGKLLEIDCHKPFRIRDGSKFGFVDRTLKPITDIKFEAAYPFSEHAAVVKLDDRFGYIKDDGAWLIEPRFDHAESFRGGAALVNVGGKFGYIKADGRWLVAPSFDEATSFQSGFAVVTVDGKHGILDPSGVWILDTKISRLNFNPAGGLYPFKSQKGWGFVDASGNSVIEEKYDAVTPFQRGISWVKLNNSWCSIDRHGQPVSNLSCQAIEPNISPTLNIWPE